MGVTDRILRYVTRFGPVESWRIADRLKLEPSAVHGVVQNLERQGRVVKDGLGERHPNVPGGMVPPLWKATGRPTRKRGPKPRED